MAQGWENDVLDIIFSWDFENLRPVDTYSLVTNTVTLVQSQLPDHLKKKPARVRFEAFADLSQFSRSQIEGCIRAKVKLNHIPIVTKGDSRCDREIMGNIYSYALENPRPSIICLLSSDQDFQNTISSLTTMGYTTILVPRKRKYDYAFDKLCDHVYYWDDLINNKLDGPKKLKPLALKEIPKHVNLLGNRSSFFWDFNSFPMAQNVWHQNVFYRLLKVLNLTSGELAKLRAFGDLCNLPVAVHQIPEFIYTTTVSTDPQNRSENLENSLIPALYEFAFYNPPPTNIVVVTANKNLASTILCLKRHGFKITLCIPPPPGSPSSVLPRQVKISEPGSKSISGRPNSEKGRLIGESSASPILSGKEKLKQEGRQSKISEQGSKSNSRSKSGKNMSSQKGRKQRKSKVIPKELSPPCTRSSGKGKKFSSGSSSASQSPKHVKGWKSRKADFEYSSSVDVSSDSYFEDAASIVVPLWPQ